MATSTKPRITARDVARGNLPAKPKRTRQSRITQPGYGKGRRPKNAGKRYPRQALTPAETLRLVEQCGGGKVGERNRALIAIMWRSALRVSEALDLLPHDIDVERGTVFVRCGKGSKSRLVGIDPYGLELIRPWSERRATLPIAPGAPFICCVTRGSEGNPVHPAFARALMTRLGRQAGIDKRCHPHGLRHTCAGDLRRERVDVTLIKQQLGHASLDMTMRYLGDIAPEEVVAAMGRRPMPGAPRQDVSATPSVAELRRMLEQALLNEQEEQQP